MNTRKVLLSTVAAAALAIAGFTAHGAQAEGVQAEEAAPVDITRAATDMPAPTGRSTAETVRLTAEPLSDVQTITVPPGGAAAVDFKVEVPGDYVLVDHALSRAMGGLVGTLPEQPEIFREGIDEKIGMVSE